MPHANLLAPGREIKTPLLHPKPKTGPVHGHFPEAHSLTAAGSLCHTPLWRLGHELRLQRSTSRNLAPRHPKSPAQKGVTSASGLAPPTHSLCCRDTHARTHKHMHTRSSACSSLALPGPQRARFDSSAAHSPLQHALPSVTGCSKFKVSEQSQISVWKVLQSVTRLRERGDALSSPCLPTGSCQLLLPPGLPRSSQACAPLLHPPPRIPSEPAEAAGG